MSTVVMEQAVNADAVTGVRVTCAPGARKALADDLAVDVELMLAYLPPPFPCRVDIGVPARVRSFLPMRVCLTGEPTQRPLASSAWTRYRPGMPDLARLSRDTLPEVGEALALGRIALALTWADGVLSNPLSSQELANWTDRFLHLLTGRWTGDACACCT
jgi:hypothetical protein